MCCSVRIDSLTYLGLRGGDSRSLDGERAGAQAQRNGRTWVSVDQKKKAGKTAVRIASSGPKAATQRLLFPWQQGTPTSYEPADLGMRHAAGPAAGIHVASQRTSNS
jgi:hypothetical protein